MRVPADVGVHADVSVKYCEQESENILLRVFSRDKRHTLCVHTSEPHWELNMSRKCVRNDTRSVCRELRIRCP